jgi:hypothetical protein
MARKTRAQSLERIAEAQALLAKVERLRLLQMERELAELRDLEHTLVKSLAEGGDPRISAAYAQRIRALQGTLRQTMERVHRQAEEARQQAAREKSAERLYDAAAQEAAREAEKAELARVIELTLQKISLP